MGAVRLAGKTLKIAGGMLDTDEVEDYILDRGGELVEKAFVQLPVKFLAGKARAKKRAIKVLMRAINDSEALRTAVENSLNKLPLLIVSRTEDIRLKGPEALVRNEPYDHYVVACPRGVVLQKYELQLLNDLRNSAELADYAGLPEVFLKRLALESEQAYFDSASGGNQLILPEANHLIFDTDATFRWDLKELNGHYYVGYVMGYSVNFEKKGLRNEFVADIAPSLKSLKVALGKMSYDEREEVKSSLDAVPD